VVLRVEVRSRNPPAGRRRHQNRPAIVRSADFRVDGACVLKNSGQWLPAKSYSASVNPEGGFVSFTESCGGAGELVQPNSGMGLRAASA